MQQDREPPSRFGIGNPSVPDGVFAGGLGRRDRQAGSGARWREPDRAALAGRFRVLDRAENAVRQAADADGARNATGRLLDVRPERPDRRFARPRPDGSAPTLRGSNRNTSQSLPVATYNGCTAGCSTSQRAVTIIEASLAAQCAASERKADGGELCPTGARIGARRYLAVDARIGKGPDFTRFGNSNATTPFSETWVWVIRTLAPRREQGELGKGRVRVARSAAWMPLTETRRSPALLMRERR